MSSVATGFTSRYANALFELADEAGVLDTVAKDLDGVVALIEANPDLARLVASPAIPHAAQARAMQAVLAKAGASPLVQQFIGVVASNGRLFALTPIIAQFQQELAQSRGEVAAEVTSAIPLNQTLTRELRQSVAKMAGSKKTALVLKVDPSLIGGLIVRVGSLMIDSSIKSKVNRLELTMKGVG